MGGMQKKKGQNCNNSDSIRYLGTNSFFKNMKINWSRQFKFNCERHMAIANVIGFHIFSRCIFMKRSVVRFGRIFEKCTLNSVRFATASKFNKQTD